jgi:hypothetical protein
MSHLFQFSPVRTPLFKKLEPLFGEDVIMNKVKLAYREKQTHEERFTINKIALNNDQIRVLNRLFAPNQVFYIKSFIVYDKPSKAECWFYLFDEEGVYSFRIIDLVKNKPDKSAIQLKFRIMDYAPTKGTSAPIPQSFRGESAKYKYLHYDAEATFEVLGVENTLETGEDDTDTKYGLNGLN